MSFGFSLGDFIAVAQLAYQLSKALSESKGATKEYQRLITELDVVHRVLLQVNDLRASNLLSQATVNALQFTVNSTRELIESFLDGHSAYSRSLMSRGSRNPIKDMLFKSKAGHDTRCSVELRPRIGRPSRWNDIRTAGKIYDPYDHQGRNQEFKQQKKPVSFFRPGQIFTAQITSSLRVKSKPTFRKVDFGDFGNLPLKPISKLRAIAKEERLEDMSKRLAQIRQLPLERMTRYCKDIPGDRRKVQCLLCKDGSEGSIELKDDWADLHFRASHREYYFGMIPNCPWRCPRAIPWEDQLRKLPHPESTEFSAEEWILLEDITLDIPIHQDSSFLSFTLDHGTMGGPIIIQRFIVVREDRERCLCLGIHTYARQGCGDQSDQELHGILSSGKTPPPLKPNETKIILSPVRMKPDHPSLALSSTARIHYGRAYEIDHKMPVQPIGLIHPASMETLLNQFEANVARLQPGEILKDGYEEEELYTAELQQTVEDVTPSIEAAYTSMNIVKDMRRSMQKVLGPNLALLRDYYCADRK